VVAQVQVLEQADAGEPQPLAPVAVRQAGVVLVVSPLPRDATAPASAMLQRWALAPALPPATG
jgi:hypothetical protein